MLGRCVLAEIKPSAIDNLFGFCTAERGKDRKVCCRHCANYGLPLFEGAVRHAHNHLPDDDPRKEGTALALSEFEKRKVPQSIDVDLLL